MENFKDLIRKRLSLQYRGKNIIWSICVNEVKNYFRIEKIDPQTQKELLTWYVRQQKLFLKTTNQKLKIDIFKEKTIIINKVNNRLSEIGYDKKIDDIILK